MMRITQKQAQEIYTRENNAGNGYAPDEERIEDAVREIVEEFGGEVVCKRTASDEVVAVLCDDGDLVIIGGDAMGRKAWAVQVAASQYIDA